MLLLAIAGCSGDDGPTSGDLAVLNYNIHGLPPEITGDDSVGRAAAIGALLSGYDVVGVQEDWTPEVDAALDGAIPEPFPVHPRFDQPSGDDKVYGSGLVTYATVPFVAYDQQYFTTCNGLTSDGSDCFASKGWQALRLELAPGVTLDFYDSHMDAGSAEGDDAARAVQVDQLVDAMNGWSAGRAIVFVADTNLSGGDPVDQPHVDHWLEAASLDEACALVDCPEPDRGDRIFVRSGGGVDLEVEDWQVDPAFVDASGAPLSDHDPLLVHVGWSTP